MKYIVLNFFILLFPVSSFAAQMGHPVFGYYYDVESSHYESASNELLEKADVTSDKYWIYASAYDEKVNLSYLIIGGIIPIYSDEDQPKIIGYEPDFGVVLTKDKKGTIKVIGTPDVVLDEGDIPESIKDQLNFDAVNRSINAEGKENFIKNVNKESVLNMLSPYTKKIIQDMSK